MSFSVGLRACVNTKERKAHIGIMETPNYIKSLIIPRNGQKVRARRVWGIDLAQVWLPFLTATNTAGETHIPLDALGAPLRLAYNPDGSVRFSKTGRPVQRVVKDIADTVRLVRENFVANLMDYTSQVQETMPDQYQAQFETAVKAGEPIIQKDSRNLDRAIVQRNAEALKLAEKEAKAPKGEKVPVPA